MTANPFSAAEAVAPRVKCLIYGPSGVGKTYLALTSPGKVAVIDTEGGTAFYANRAGLSEFDVLPTKTFNDVTRAIAYLKDHPGEYETLVIDPVTVLYETLQDAAQLKRAGRRNDPDADLEMLDWQRIKRAYKALMTDLVNLPMHVLVTARERDENEQRGRESVKVGVKPDAEKSTPYYFDVIVRLTAKDGKRAAVIEKDRTGTLPGDVAGPSFAKLFAKAIKAGAGATGERTMADDGAAAETDASTTFADDVVIHPGADGGYTGKVQAGKGVYDLVLRTTPDRGTAIGFRLRAGRQAVAVEAFGALADTLDAQRLALDRQVVTAYGTVRVVDDLIEGRRVSWSVLTLAYLTTPIGRIPAAVDEPTDDVALPGEAETAELGLVAS